MNDENDELCDELDEKDVTIKNLEQEVQESNDVHEALQVELYEELNKKDTVIRNLERKL